MGRTYSGESVLITGGAGFLGSNLAHKLVKFEANVKIIDNFSSGKKENIAEILGDIELIEGDIRDTELVKKILRDVNIVFHLAAIPSVELSVKDPVLTNDINLVASIELFRLCGELGVKTVVFASSSAVYGTPRELPITEDHPLTPISPYGIQKLASEHYGRIFAQKYGYNFIALRFFNIYGPRQDPNSPYAAVIPRFVDALMKGRAPVIFGDGHQTRDFVYVDDAVSALMLAGMCGKSGIFNIASGKNTKIIDLANVLRNIIGGREPRFDAPRPGDIRHSWADISLAASALKYKPVYMLEDGLKHYIDWYKSQVTV